MKNNIKKRIIAFWLVLLIVFSNINYMLAEETFLGGDMTEEVLDSSEVQLSESVEETDSGENISKETDAHLEETILETNSGENISEDLGVQIEETVLETNSENLEADINIEQSINNQTEQVVLETSVQSEQGVDNNVSEEVKVEDINIENQENDLEEINKNDVVKDIEKEPLLKLDFTNENKEEVKKDESLLIYGNIFSEKGFLENSYVDVKDVDIESKNRLVKILKDKLENFNVEEKVWLDLGIYIENEEIKDFESEVKINLYVKDVTKLKETELYQYNKEEDTWVKVDFELCKNEKDFIEWKVKKLSPFIFVNLFEKQSEIDETESEVKFETEIIDETESEVKFETEIIDETESEINFETEIIDETESETEDLENIVEYLKDPLVYDGEDYHITLTFDENSKIPVGSVLEVKEILNNSEDYEKYSERVVDTLYSDAKKLSYGRFFDVMIISSNGEEIEPEGEVLVNIILDEDIPIEENVETNVVHIIEQSEDVVVEDVSLKEITIDNDFEFEAESFSVYGVVCHYTVDFYYDEKDYHLDGGNEISIKDLFNYLEIEKNVENIYDIEFTNDTVIEIIKDGWILKSIVPFMTEEELRIYFNNGEVLTIFVMDEVSTYTVSYNANGGYFNNSTVLNNVVYRNFDNNDSLKYYSHTSNISDSGVQSGNYSSSLRTKSVITVPNASSIHVKLTYGTENGYDKVYVFKGNFTGTITNNMSSALYTYQGNNNSPKTVEFDIADTDTVTFGFYSDSSVNYYGYFAIVTGEYDIIAEGNYLLPSKDGFSFKGWNTRSDGSGEFVCFDSVSEDSIFYAIYIENIDIPAGPNEVEVYSYKINYHVDSTKGYFSENTYLNSIDYSYYNSLSKKYDYFNTSLGLREGYYYSMVNMSVSSASYYDVYLSYDCNNKDLVTWLCLYGDDLTTHNVSDVDESLIGKFGYGETNSNLVIKMRVNSSKIALWRMGTTNAYGSFNLYITAYDENNSPIPYSSFWNQVGTIKVPIGYDNYSFGDWYLTEDFQENTRHLVTDRFTEEYDDSIVDVYAEMICPKDYIIPEIPSGANIFEKVYTLNYFVDLNCAHFSNNSDSNIIKYKKKCYYSKYSSNYRKNIYETCYDSVIDDNFYQWSAIYTIEGASYYDIYYSSYSIDTSTNWFCFFADGEGLRSSVFSYKDSVEGIKLGDTNTYSGKLRINSDVFTICGFSNKNSGYTGCQDLYVTAYDINGNPITVSDSYSKEGSYSNPSPVSEYIFLGWYGTEDFQDGTKLEGYDSSFGYDSIDWDNWNSIEHEKTLYGKVLRYIYHVPIKGYYKPFDVEEDSCTRTYSIYFQSENGSLKEYILKGYSTAGYTLEFSDSVDGEYTSEYLIHPDDALDLVLYTRAIPNTYIIHLIVDGDLYEDIEVTYDANYEIIAPERFGYEFEKFKYLGRNVDFDQSGIYTVSNDVLIEAVYSKKQYNVEYYANNGTDDLMNSETFYHENYEIENNIFEKEGYAFVKWNTEADGSGIDYMVGQTVRFTEGENCLKLYAIYAEATLLSIIDGMTINIKDESENLLSQSSINTVYKEHSYIVSLENIDINEEKVVDGVIYSYPLPKQFTYLKDEELDWNDNWLTLVQKGLVIGKAKIETIDDMQVLYMVFENTADKEDIIAQYQYTSEVNESVFIRGTSTAVFSSDITYDLYLYNAIDPSGVTITTDAKWLSSEYNLGDDVYSNMRSNIRYANSEYSDYIAYTVHIDNPNHKRIKGFRINGKNIYFLHSVYAIPNGIVRYGDFLFKNNDIDFDIGTYIGTSGDNVKFENIQVNYDKDNEFYRGRYGYALDSVSVDCYDCSFVNDLDFTFVSCTYDGLITNENRELNFDSYIEVLFEEDISFSVVATAQKKFTSSLLGLGVDSDSVSVTPTIKIGSSGLSWIHVDETIPSYSEPFSTTFFQIKDSIFDGFGKFKLNALVDGVKGSEFIFSKYYSTGLTSSSLNITSELPPNIYSIFRDLKINFYEEEEKWIIAKYSCEEQNIWVAMKYIPYSPYYTGDVIDTYNNSYNSLLPYGGYPNELLCDIDGYGVKREIYFISEDFGKSLDGVVYSDVYYAAVDNTKNSLSGDFDRNPTYSAKSDNFKRNFEINTGGIKGANIPLKLTIVNDQDNCASKTVVTHEGGGVLRVDVKYDLRSIYNYIAALRAKDVSYHSIGSGQGYDMLLTLKVPENYELISAPSQKYTPYLHCYSSGDFISNASSGNVYLKLTQNEEDSWTKAKSGYVNTQVSANTSPYDRNGLSDLVSMIPEEYKNVSGTEYGILWSPGSNVYSCKWAYVRYYLKPLDDLECFDSVVDVASSMYLLNSRNRYRYTFNNTPIYRAYTLHKARFPKLEKTIDHVGSNTTNNKYASYTITVSPNENDEREKIQTISNSVMIWDSLYGSEFVCEGLQNGSNLEYHTKLSDDLAACTFRLKNLFINDVDCSSLLSNTDVIPLGESYIYNCDNFIINERSYKVFIAAEYQNMPGWIFSISDNQDYKDSDVHVQSFTIKYDIEVDPSILQSYIESYTSSPLSSDNLITHVNFKNTLGFYYWTNDIASGNRVEVIGGEWNYTISPVIRKEMVDEDVHRHNLLENYNGEEKEYLQVKHYKIKAYPAIDCQTPISGSVRLMDGFSSVDYNNLWGPQPFIVVYGEGYGTLDEMGIRQLLNYYHIDNFVLSYLPYDDKNSEIGEQYLIRYENGELLYVHPDLIWRDSLLYRELIGSSNVSSAVDEVSSDGTLMLFDVSLTNDWVLPENTSFKLEYDLCLSNAIVDDRDVWGGNIISLFDNAQIISPGDVKASVTMVGNGNSNGDVWLNTPSLIKEKKEGVLSHNHLSCDSSRDYWELIYNRGTVGYDSEVLNTIEDSFRVTPLLSGEPILDELLFNNLVSLYFKYLDVRQECLYLYNDIAYDYIIQDSVCPDDNEYLYLSNDMCEVYNSENYNTFSYVAANEDSMAYASMPIISFNSVLPRKHSGYFVYSTKLDYDSFEEEVLSSELLTLSQLRDLSFARTNVVNDGAIVESYYEEYREKLYVSGNLTKSGEVTDNDIIWRIKSIVENGPANNFILKDTMQAGVEETVNDLDEAAFLAMHYGTFKIEDEEGNCLYETESNLIDNTTYDLPDCDFYKDAQLIVDENLRWKLQCGKIYEGIIYITYTTELNEDEYLEKGGKFTEEWKVSNKVEGNCESVDWSVDTTVTKSYVDEGNVTKSVEELDDYKRQYVINAFVGDYKVNDVLIYDMLSSEDENILNYLTIDSMKIELGVDDLEIVYDTNDSVDFLEDNKGSIVFDNENHLFDLMFTVLPANTKIKITYTTDLNIIPMDGGHYSVLNKVVFSRNDYSDKTYEIPTSYDILDGLKKQGSSYSPFTNEIEYAQTGEPYIYWTIDIHADSVFTEEELSSVEFYEIIDTLPQTMEWVDGESLWLYDEEGNELERGVLWTVSTDNRDLRVGEGLHINIQVKDVSVRDVKVILKTISKVSTLNLSNKVDLIVGNKKVEEKSLPITPVRLRKESGFVTGWEKIPLLLKAKKYVGLSDNGSGESVWALATESFDFSIVQVDENGDEIENGYTDEAQSDSSGIVTFSETARFGVGVYYFKVKEISDDSRSDDYIFDNSEYIIKAIVVKDDAVLNATYETVGTLLEYPEFYNEEKVHSLSISKIVSGNLGDTSRSFIFKIDLKNPSVVTDNGVLHYIKESNGSVEEDDLDLVKTDDGWQAIFELSHEDIITFTNIIHGTLYNVIESDDTALGYNVTYTNQTNSLTEDMSVEIVNEKQMIVPTGIKKNILDINIILFIVLCLIMLLIGSYFLREKIKIK